MSNFSFTYQPHARGAIKYGTLALINLFPNNQVNRKYDQNPFFQQILNLLRCQKYGTFHTKLTKLFPNSPRPPYSPR